MRVFPVPYRLLARDKQFTKYQWITATFKRASGDSRPESHNISVDTIELGTKVDSDDGWAERKKILAPLMRQSHCAIQRERDQYGHPTLGLFRPKAIKRLVIKPGDSDWTPKQKAILNQPTLGLDAVSAPRDELEKIPFDFYYEFTCDDPSCRTHTLSCTDWEMAQAYRNWRRDYGDGWEEKFREKFERDMIHRFDTHFYVGTIHQHPKNWIIVGLFYPPKPKPPPSQGSLF